jgi:broad specificity phosphatase PhoE
MKPILTVLVLFLLLTSCGHTYYVVRHAEKAVASPGTTMSTPNDPPLSAAGEERAQALKEVLKDKKIEYIFSTNTVRTRTTAEPLRSHRSLSIQTYGPMPDSAFIRQLKALKYNVLVVGHSNTVDNIVNGLTNTATIPADLQDSEYDNLFVINYKRFFGTRIKYERLKFGTPSK